MAIDLDDSLKNDKEYRKNLMERFTEIEARFQQAGLVCKHWKEELDKINRDHSIKPFTLAYWKRLFKSEGYLLRLISDKIRQIDFAKDMEKILKFLESSKYYSISGCAEAHQSVLTYYKQYASMVWRELQKRRDNLCPIDTTENLY